MSCRTPFPFSPCETLSASQNNGNNCNCNCSQNCPPFPMPRPPGMTGDLLKAVTIQDNVVAVGQSVVFVDTSIVSGTSIVHCQNSPVFIISQSGLYSISYRFNYLASEPGILAFELRGHTSSRVVQQVSAAQQLGHLSSIDVLSLAAGATIELYFVPAPVSTISSVTLSNAAMIIQRIG